MQATGTVLGLHARTPAPTARGWRRGSAWPQTPLATATGAPHGDNPPQVPARAHAVRQEQGPHAHTNHTQDTRVTEPRPPGEGQQLTPDAPHNGGGPNPPETASNHPRGTQPPQGKQAKATVLGPHTCTPAPTARGQRSLAAPRRVAAGGGRAPGIGRPWQRGHHGRWREST